MVDNKLPNARSATQRIIEVAAQGNGGSLLTEVDDEDDQQGRIEKRQVHSRA